jgi:hypothetical protein
MKILTFEETEIMTQRVLARFCFYCMQTYGIRESDWWHLVLKFKTNERVEIIMSLLRDPKFNQTL